MNKVRVKIMYKILTVDGHVVRPKASRPYIAGWVCRNLNDMIVKGCHYEFTINPKYPIGTIGRTSITRRWKYERLVHAVIN